MTISFPTFLSLYLPRLLFPLPPSTWFPSQPLPLSSAWWAMFVSKLQIIVSLHPCWYPLCLDYFIVWICLVLHIIFLLCMYVVIFYLMAPFPLGIVRCLINREFLEEGGKVALEIAYFVSACIVISGFGLPLVLAHSGVIPILSGVIACIGNLFMFGTVYSYFIFFRSDDEWEFSSFWFSIISHLFVQCLYYSLARCV